MRRREFITRLGVAAMIWPLAARAAAGTAVVGFISGASPDAFAREATAFRKGLNEAGAIEGQNVTVEYHWLEGQYDRLPVLVADLVRRKVAVIASFGNVSATLAAKAATSTIPIVFSVPADPAILATDPLTAICPFG